MERWPLLEVRLYILGNRMVLQVVDGKDYAQIWKCSMLQGLLTRREEDFSTRKILEKREHHFVEFTCRNCGPYCYQLEKELKMVGNNNKHAIFAFLLFSLAFIITSQQMVVLSNW